MVSVFSACSAVTNMERDGAAQAGGDRMPGGPAAPPCGRLPAAPRILLRVGASVC